MRSSLLVRVSLLSMVWSVTASKTGDTATRMQVLKRTTHCPAQTYPDPQTSVCTPCADPNALKCSAGGALSCAPGTYIYQSACVSVCPAGTRKAGHGCLDCQDPNAVTCSSTKSMSCVSNFFVYLGVCVAPCPTGTRRNAKGLDCEACSDPDATTCTKFHATACLTRNLSNGVCVATCPQKTFAQNQVCTRCVDPNAGTCDSSGATSCEKLNLFAGACGTCPDGTHSKRHVCVPCKEADAKTCSSSVATSCKTLNLSNGACIATCPTGTYSLNQVCVACTDSRAATCKEDGSSLTCTDSTYQVDTTTGLCALPVSVGTAFSRVQNYHFGDQAQVLGARPEAGCIAAWITSDRDAAFLSGSVCLLGSGSITAFYYGAGENVRSYLTGSCASNADLFASAVLFVDEVEGPPPFSPTAMCQDVVFNNGVCTVDGSGLVCGTCPDPDASTCTGSLSTSCTTLNLFDNVCTETCPAGTYALSQVCTPCSDSGASKCDTQGLSLTCTDPTYQVDPTTRICGPVEAAPIAISYITDYYFSNANPYETNEPVSSVAQCIADWISSGFPAGLKYSGSCYWDDTGITSFIYGGGEGVSMYLRGTCASNADLFSSTSLSNDDGNYAPPVTPADICEDATFSNGVCTGVVSNTVCGS